jgi:hypothetical protein
MTRQRAALIHLSISLLVVASVFLVVYFAWYPPPLFEGAGGQELFLVLALVDVTVGPMLTFIIFKPGKWGLKFDLTVIAIMQVVALAYGAHVVYEARPVWLVFVKGRFDLIRANQVVAAEVKRAQPEFQEFSMTGPKVVGARVPKDPVEQMRIAMTALAGMDVSSYPQFYVPYPELSADVLAKARPMADLRRLNPDRGSRIDAAVAASGRKESDLAFVPMRAGKRDLAVLVDAKTAAFIAPINVKPWEQ